MHDRLVRLLIFSGPVVRERFSHARHSFRNRKIALESQRRAGSFAQPLLVERATSTRHATSLILRRPFKEHFIDSPTLAHFSLSQPRHANLRVKYQKDDQ